MVKGKPEAILDDLEKLSAFLETVEKDDKFGSYRNYDHAVFLLLKGELNEITRALESKKASEKNSMIMSSVCLTTKRKKIRMACLADLKK